MSVQAHRDHRWLLRGFSVAIAVATIAALAVPAMAAKGGGAALAFVQQPTDSSAAEIISPDVVVAVMDSRGRINTRSKAVITLALQGGAGTLYGTTTRAAVGGLATFSDLAVDPAGTYTLRATDGNNVAPATSAAFAITGFAVDCPAGTCSQSTGNIGNPTPQDSVIGVVTVPTTECAAETCFMTVDETPGDICSPACKGNAVKFIPPSNAAGIFEVLWGCDKSLCPGTGVSNFSMWLEKSDLTIVRLDDCPNPSPGDGDLPCIQRRSRTGVGDLLMTVWLTANADPRIAGG